MKYQIKSDKGYYSRSMSTGKAVFYNSNEMGYTFTKEEAEKMLDKLEKETGKDLEIVEYKKENFMADGGSVWEENDFIEYSRHSPQEWELVEWSTNGHSPDFKGQKYYQNGTGSMFIQKENGDIYKPNSSNKLFWRKIKNAGMMEKGGKISNPTFVFDVVLYNNDENYTIKEKKIYKVKASNRSSAYEKAKKKYPKPYFVELNSVDTYADGGGIDSEYEDYEMVVISKDAEKDGGGTHSHRYLVSAKNIKEAKEIATEMFYEEWGDADFYLFEVISEDNYRKNYMADGGSVSDSIAMTILKQLGGMNRLIVMTGAYNFIDLGNGVSFKIKNQRANYIKITLNYMDLYDLEVGRIRGTTYKVVATHKDVYFDQLKPLIEKATGMYLSLFAKGGKVKREPNDVFDAYVPPTPEEKAAKQQKQAQMAMMFVEDGAQIVGLNEDKLDMYEKMRYDGMLKKGISKKSALEILINDVDGDYSQLSPELRKYAIFVYESGWGKTTHPYKFAQGGLMDEMKEAKKILGEQKWNKMSEDDRLEATKYLIRKGKIEGSREEYEYDSYSKGGILKSRRFTEGDFGKLTENDFYGSWDSQNAEPKRFYLVKKEKDNKPVAKFYPFKEELVVTQDTDLINWLYHNNYLSSSEHDKVEGKLKK
jgi:hypothetical protein